MNHAEKLLALKLEGFYVAEGVLSSANAARICQSAEDTLDQGPIYGSNFLNYDQSLAPHLADERIVDSVRAIHSAGARIIANGGNLRDPNPDAAHPGRRQSQFIPADFLERKLQLLLAQLPRSPAPLRRTPTPDRSRPHAHRPLALP